jgi:hypothetical protein
LSESAAKVKSVSEKLAFKMPIYNQAPDKYEIQLFYLVGGSIRLQIIAVVNMSTKRLAYALLVPEQMY